MTGIPRPRVGDAPPCDRAPRDEKVPPSQPRRRVGRPTVRVGDLRAGRVAATAVLAVVVAATSAAASGAGTASDAPSARRTTRDVPTSSRIPVPSSPARGIEALAARLSQEAVAFAAAQQQEALSLSRAAVQAARGAAAVSGAAGATDVQQQLQVAGDELMALRAASWPGGAPQAGGRRADVLVPDVPRVVGARAAGGEADAVTTTLADLVAARELEAAAHDVFAFVFEAEGPTRAAVAEIGSVPLAGLADVDAALDVAEQTAADLVLAPLVPLEPTTLLRVGALPGELVGDLSLPYPNGAIPTEVLCAPDLAPHELLRCDAAAAFDLLAARYLADTGRPLTIVSSYRTYERQVEVKRLRGMLAATPGTSQHGLGVAVDLADAGEVGQFDTPVYRWMKEHAEQFGWAHPAAMEPGGRGPQEPWHWEFVGW